MKISYNWLKNYIDTELPADDAAEKLTLLGLEVEETEHFGANLDGFIVGEVLDVKNHPNADRLYLCQVNLGDSNVQIVCGADNVASGQKVPVATVGATLPVPKPDGSPLTIRKAKLRGETSEGMICAEDELGLSDDHSGIMVLDNQLEPGTDLRQALNIESDSVFEIGLTPNRPDAACHIGVARDLAAVLGKNLSNPYNIQLEEEKPLDNHITISIKDSDKCHRYTAKMVKGVSVGESPQWLKNRLLSIGLRPINNIVDATNYVLHEIGQPLHAFDYDKLADKKIVVKSFDKETTFTTLDDIERKVPAETLFICDGKKPVAIAGVMGGVNSEVTDQTDTILIESAYFNPSHIRKASKALALQTDSSYRFERGIDPTLARRAAEKAAELIADLTGGRIVEGCTDQHPVKPEKTNVDLRISRINHVLGTEISAGEAVDILDRLEIETKKSGDGEYRCTIPYFRPDLTREIDLIEEVGRIHDYNNIPRPESAPFHQPSPISNWEQFNNRARTVVSKLGYKEITTNSLLSQKEADLFASEKEQIHTLNPVSREATTLRTTLTGGFLKVLQHNVNRNAKQLRFFEIGHIYKYDREGTWIKGIKEHSHLLMGLCGFKSFENWQTDPVMYSVFDLKKDLEAFFDPFGVGNLVKRSSGNPDQLTYKIKDKVVATLKRIDPKLTEAYDIELPAVIAEIDLSVLHSLNVIRSDTRYQPVSKFPPFSFDAAFIVDNQITAGQLTDKIRQTAGDILDNVDVFDVYEGENLGKDKKSIAFRLTFLDRNKTLNIKDVEPVVQKIVQVLDSEFRAKLRS